MTTSRMAIAGSLLLGLVLQLGCAQNPGRGPERGAEADPGPTTAMSVVPRAGDAVAVLDPLHPEGLTLAPQVVDADDGTIELPWLGSFILAGETKVEVEKILRAKYQQLLGEPSDLTLRVSKREDRS